MGVNGLHKYITKRSSIDQLDGVNKHTFVHLIPPGRETVFVGVDAFGWLYPAVRSKAAAGSHHTIPPVPNAPALQAFKDKCRVMIACECIPVICLDGAANPLKRDTFLARTGLIDKAEANLTKLLSEGRSQSFKEVEKLRQASATIRPDLIADIINFCQESNIPLVQAPCEAEHQLVELEQCGLIDSILSEDGDTLILGGKTVITRVQWNYKQPSESSCCIYRSSQVWKRPSAGSGRWNHWLPELSCFLGNDYISNLLDVGAGCRGPKLLEQYISQPTQDARQSMLDELAKSRYWSKGDKAIGLTAVGFPAKFLSTASFIRHCPVWRFQPSLDVTGGATDVVKLARLGTFQISLEPLNSLPLETNRSDWGKYIGFSNHPGTFLPSGVSFKQICSMERSARTGLAFTSVPQPTLQHPPHYQVAYGTYLDFKACPVVLQPDSCLKQFLFVRRLAPKGRPSRESLIELVCEIVSLEKRQPGATARPMQLSQMKLNSASYQVFESLKPQDTSTGLAWYTNGADVLARVRIINPINDAVVDDNFGLGHNGVRYRAVCRIRGGNYNVMTLQFAKVLACTQAGDTNAVAFRIKTTPSMKSPEYWTTLVYEDKNNGRLIPAPNSRCECPAGALSCSHMLGLQGIFYTIQQSMALTLHDVAALLPPPIKSVANSPIPWSFAFGRNSTTEARLSSADVGLKRKNLTILETPKAKPRQKPLDADNGQLQSSPTNVMDFPGEIFGSVIRNSTNDDESDRCEDDDNDDFHDDDVDNFDEDDDDDDYSYQGSYDDDDDGFATDSECGDNQEAGSLHQDEYDDDLIEDEAQKENLPTDTPFTSIRLCEEVEKMLAEAALRADKSDGYEHDYKVKASNIEIAINNKLAGVGGPNESPLEKREQLEFHERLNKLFKGGQLPKTVISHYLLATEVARKRWLSQLSAGIEANVTITMPPVRLEKVPLGTNVLADRGFASCAVMYPFLNAMVTPFFLDGRSQFTMDEISADRTKCQLRWASEAVFSRVWMVLSLRDKVGRGLFEVLHHFVDWAHGLANLQKPFYKPGNDTYFDQDWDGCLNVEGYTNYIDYAVPTGYTEAGMADTGAVLKDGKDFVTDTVRKNPVLTRAQFSDKVKSSGGRIITWALPTGLVFEHTGLFLGRVPEIRLVELWGRR